MPASEEQYTQIYTDLLKVQVIEEALQWLQTEQGPQFVGALLRLLEFSDKTDDDEKVEAEKAKVLKKYPFLISAKIKERDALPFLLSAINNLAKRNG